MSPRPVVPLVSELWYNELAVSQPADEKLGWPLLLLLAGMGAAFGELPGVIRDTDEGPGWSSLLDPDRCPVWALPWLAQFAGVTLTPGLTEAQWREEITSPPAFERGTPGAMADAARRHLTGDRRVLLVERNETPWRDLVITYDSETPDPDATERDVLAQEGAGRKVIYRTDPGWDIDQMEAAYTDLDALEAAFTANLVDNPSFEADTAGWATSGGFVVGGALVRDPAEHWSGAASLRVTAAAADEGTLTTVTQPVAAGETYTVAFYAKGVAGGETLGMIFGSGVSDYTSLGITLTAAWQRFTLTWTATAPAANFSLWLRQSGATPRSWWLDAVMVVAGSSAPAYFEGSGLDALETQLPSL